MSNIQIVTDSTAYFTKEYIEENNIKVVPLSVRFGDDVSDEGFPGEFEGFFKRLETSDVFPSTSQPSIEAFAQVYREALDQGKEIITIVISSDLSGTYNSASIAAQQTEPDKISVIDSKTTVSNLRLLVESIKAYIEEGKTREEIVGTIEDEKTRMAVDLTVDTLEYLKKGGRLSTAQAFVGNVLNVKPIISLIDGKLVPAGKVRGKNKAIETIMDKIPHEVKYITVAHVISKDEAEVIKAVLEKRFPHISIEIDELGPVIGSHLGPGGIGICYKW